MAENVPELSQQESTATSAARAAGRCLAANLRALRSAQRDLADAVERMILDVEWVYARDGSLTAMEHGRRWWAGCSLPKKAASFMLQKADLSANVICFLTPSYAAQLRVCLDRMHGGQAVIALCPSLASLKVILACDDFAADIAAHRLYFAWGENWLAALDQLLIATPGLPTPGAFVRPIAVDTSAADALIPPAQQVFSQIAQRRSDEIVRLRGNWRPANRGKICLVAPSQFRLWDDTGHALHATLARASGGERFIPLDTDDPASASPLALTMAASDAGALVTPNVCRAMLPDLIALEMPWVTWITSPRIVPFSRCGPKDALLLADPGWIALARQAGWPAERLFPAGWPAGAVARVGGPVPGVYVMPRNPVVSIFRHTQPLDPPPRVKDFSSQRVLWDAIAQRLLTDPLSAGDAPEALLREEAKRARLDESTLESAAFLELLIPNAIAQGMARLLIAEGIAVKLYGRGWDTLDEFKDHAAGPLATRQQFELAVHESTAIIHVEPGLGAHPGEALGKPVIRGHRRRDALLRSVRSALAGRLATPMPKTPPLSIETVLAALG